MHGTHRHAQILPGPECPGAESVEAEPAQRPVFCFRQSPQDPDENAVLHAYRVLFVGQAPGARAVPGAPLVLWPTGPDPDGFTATD